MLMFLYCCCCCIVVVDVVVVLLLYCCCCCIVVVAKQHITSRVHITTQQIERTLDGPGPSANIKMGNIHDLGKEM